MSFHSMTHTPRTLRATEARLEAIYDAARLGLKGDNLALAAGMLPVEYARLVQMDPLAELAEQKGRADGERNAALTLVTAADAGDAKAALEVLRYSYGWAAKTQVEVTVEGQISVAAALEQAKTRVIEGLVLDRLPPTPALPDVSRETAVVG